MELPVLIEPANGTGFRASTGAPLALSVEGPTEAEALDNLRALLNARLAQGRKVVLLSVPDGPHPLARFAGQFQGDADFQEVIDIMNEYRQAEEAAGE